MTMLENEILFRPPRSRPRWETWQATYRLSRHQLLAAIEHAVARVPHPVAGLRWEYEGFRRDRVYIWQPGDLEREFPPAQVEFKMHMAADLITIEISSDIEVELLLFRRLATEMDSIDDVSQARVVPCTLLR